VDSDYNYGKEIIIDRHIEKSLNDTGKVVVTAEFKKDVAGGFGKKRKEVKCSKCQGLGYIASHCPSKQVMTITARGLIGEGEDDIKQSPDELQATIDAYYEDKEAHTFEKPGNEQFMSLVMRQSLPLISSVTDE